MAVVILRANHLFSRLDTYFERPIEEIWPERFFERKRKCFEVNYKKFCSEWLSIVFEGGGERIVFEVA